MMEFYRGRKDTNEVKEYDGYYYNLYIATSSFPYVFHCAESTIKAWGKKITEQQAREIIPNLDELRAKCEHGRQWMKLPTSPIFQNHWSEITEKQWEDSRTSVVQVIETKKEYVKIKYSWINDIKIIVQIGQESKELKILVDQFGPPKMIYLLTENESNLEHVMYPKL